MGRTWTHSKYHAFTTFITSPTSWLPVFFPSTGVQTDIPFRDCQGRCGRRWRGSTSSGGSVSRGSANCSWAATTATFTWPDGPGKVKHQEGRVYAADCHRTGGREACMIRKLVQLNNEACTKNKTLPKLKEEHSY